MAANGLELTAIASASRTPRVVTSSHPDSQTSARGEEEPDGEAEEREGEEDERKDAGLRPARGVCVLKTGKVRLFA